MVVKCFVTVVTGFVPVLDSNIRISNYNETLKIVNVTTINMHFFKQTFQNTSRIYQYHISSVGVKFIVCITLLVFVMYILSNFFIIEQQHSIVYIFGILF